MINPEPTTLQLNSEDIFEYEAQRRTWGKHRKEGEQKVSADARLAQQKKEVHDRIGYKPADKK